ncbi:putative regulator medusa [Lyophyllum shimeji]|uniref:Regulator medusa n=1 Tax=Lyophyllum shimeji TaxID=47721 RepID=A0A9P3PKP6_LYOSH|nr:putative regulator medusa [Lyophyllum shimeji]
MDLAAIKDQDELTYAVADANQLSAAAASAIAATALKVGDLQVLVNAKAPRSRFDPKQLTLFPPTTFPNGIVQRYLHSLAMFALQTAEENSCSSILAGKGSESDEFGDVALWLGSGEFQTPMRVLNALGLAEWAANGEVADYVFPRPTGNAGSQLGDMLSELKDQFSFRVQAGLTGSLVLFFLVGRVESEGYGGLLEAQIQLLSDLHTKLQTLRHIPPALLRTPLTALSTQTLRPEFQQVKEIADTIRTEAIQDALRAARDSLEGDTSDLNPNLRREKRKRRRAPSPDSPQPYIGDEEKTRRLFPDPGDDAAALKIEGLSDYIKDFNRTHEWKLHLWRRTRGDQSRTVVRFRITDVLTAYLTLGVAANGVVMTESVAAFGPRERKGPHTQSDFGVYRSVSQQVARMLEAHPTAALQQVVALLCAYSTLFTSRCSSCERVLSSEGHVPPVVRVWTGTGWGCVLGAAPMPHSYAVYPSPISDPGPRPAPRPVSDSAANVVVSPAGIIHVLGYTPTEGESGAPISVRIHFHPDLAQEIYVRLVVGHKAVPTTVREIHDAPYGRWQLDAVAPPFDQSASPSPKVLISVQALTKDDAILDTATFGEFSYWAPGSSSSVPRDVPAPREKPKLQITTSMPQPSTSFRRRNGSSQLPTPSPTSPTHPRSTSSSNPKTQVHLHRRTKLESMMRPKSGKNNDSHIQTPILDLVTPLQNICLDWTPAESSVGRRLVRFSKVQDGRRLIVSCEPIKAEDYRESDSVISCIYREESNACYVTSVDIIFLLERLTNSDFPVEEKNRIRRNLEGLRPTTVSKHKHGFEDFFQRIMEFPDPKPRNIEKDLKVFEWSLLDQALDKILSKYTIDTSSLPAEEAESSSAELSPSTGSEDPDCEVAYPNNVKMEDTYVDQTPPLPTPLQDEFPYLNSSDGSETLCSPLETPATAAYQLYNTEMVPPDAGGSNPGQWGDYKAVDSMTLDHYAAYEVTQHGTPIINYAAEVDFAASYDSFAYHGSIPGEPWA